MPHPAESPSTGPPPPRAPSLLPREHGAWGQLAFPVATGLALGRPGAAALLLAAAVIVAFLAHEPLLVFLGQRGTRTRDAHGTRARRAALGAGVAAAALAAAGVWLAGADVAIAGMPALTLGAIAVAAASARLERTTGGELVVAAALGACAAPIALASGAGPREAASASVAWIAAFSAVVLPVRAVLERARTKGAEDPRPLAALAVLGIEGVLVVSAAHEVIAWAVPLAIAPVIAAALAVTVLPVRPRRLTAVGWSVVAASAITLVALVAALRPAAGS